MDTIMINEELSLFDILSPLIIFLIILIFGIILRKILFSNLSKWAQRSKTRLDDIVIESTRGPFIIWWLMFGAYISIEASKIPEDFVHIISKILLVLTIFSVVMVLANIVTRLIRAHSYKFISALPVASFTENISRILIFGVGFLIILNSLGISITPILATLGVGGLAVALALQDTLSNLFAGFHILMSRQISIGDYIKLDTGEEGYVTDINWRITKIKMLPNNVVLVPNDKLAKAIITNYYLPDKEMAVLVNLGVHYDSDLKKVEKVTCEVAKEIMKEIPGGVSDFEPFIRYHTFADFSINFTVILRVKEFVDQYLIKHEFIKRLQERYKKEGITIPYPIRTINYEKKEIKE